MIKNKYKILSIVLLLLFIINIESVYGAGHKLESLDIDVYINGDGSARIKENRKSNLIEGTESYIIIENLGKSKITDFVVYENGERYEYIDNWNINASRQEKANKNSIINTSSGYELSWGTGEYGRHEHKLEYTITNFVKELEDSQMIFWQFVNPDTNIPPEQFTITINSDHEFTEENEKIWAFGFDGQIQFDNGSIVAISNGPLSRSNYVKVLTKLPEAMFQTEDILNSNFEEIREEAFIGSSYDEGVYEEGVYEESEQRPSDFPKMNPFSTLIRMLTRFGSIIIFIGAFVLFGKGLGGSNKSPSKFKRKYKEEYYRDYPYDASFLDIYYIPYMIGTADFENLLTGFILKWINEDRIMTVEEETGLIFKKDRTNIKFLNLATLNNTLENELFQMMITAAGSNQILEENEFTKWAGSNSRKIEAWEKKVNEDSKEKLLELGYLEMTEKKVLFFKIPEYELTEKGRQLETNIYKYINYLHDFSLLNEHEAINVKIWDNIMIWAGFLGLTDVVSKQFEKLYPRYTQETVYTGNTIFLSHHLARSISQAKTSASSSSGSSGFGGGSSMGGGGGSFGGGSGGGTR